MVLKSTPTKEKREKDFLKKEGEIRLPAFLEKVCPEQPHDVFGHSNGGTVALYYASLNPELLQGAVVEAPHVLLEEISRNGISRTQRAFLNGKLNEALNKILHPGGNFTEELLVEES